MFWPNHNVAIFCLEITDIIWISQGQSQESLVYFAQQFQQTGMKCRNLNSTERTQPDDESSTGFGHVRCKMEPSRSCKNGSF